MVRKMTHMGLNLIRKAINMYADYWKANFEDSYKAVTGTPKGGEAVVVTPDPKRKTP
jgi:hypothetical protein